ncbi:MAG: hypothetical protein ABI658_23030 [Acidimicrobiales bacterium]
MIEQGPHGDRAMRGTIRRRLLVNALVDPVEAARRLPAGLRPHLIDGGTVVGCCLLDIASIRPASLPAGVGTHLRAAAHRVSVEWDDEAGSTIVGVYVPVRHTDSRAARVLGGRWFPGVHRRASIELTDDGRSLRWLVEPSDRATQYGVSVSATIISTSSPERCEPIGGTCLRATVGLSPDRHGALEAAQMVPEHRSALQVEIDYLDSCFLAGFTTAERAPSYFMRDVDVTWTKVRPPRLALTETLT